MICSNCKSSQCNCCRSWTWWPCFISLPWSVHNKWTSVHTQHITKARIAQSHLQKAQRCDHTQWQGELEGVHIHWISCKHEAMCKSELQWWCGSRIGIHTNGHCFCSQTSSEKQICFKFWWRSNKSRNETFGINTEQSVSVHLLFVRTGWKWKIKSHWCCSSLLQMSVSSIECWRPVNALPSHWWYEPKPSSRSKAVEY